PALARERRWPEACYVGLATAALLTSTYYVSVARSTVVAFPLYLLAARRVVRARRRVRLLLAAVSVTWLCLGAFFHVHAHQLG
ncbi:MAG: hypothetical protein QOI08_2071, partial [Actinomycetota bacterium]|nr:hypothetical protein [Actinomycetota bacterium]